MRTGFLRRGIWWLGGLLVITGVIAVVYALAISLSG